MEQVKLLSMTAILTALIWASADSLVSETASIGVKFELLPRATDSTMLIELDQGAGSCELEIAGPRKIVEAVQTLGVLAARLEIPEYPTGRATIRLEPDPLRGSLGEQFHEFRKLTIVAVRPASISATIDHWTTDTVDLGMEQLTLPYEVEPQLQRSSTTVRMRESLHEEIIESGRGMSLDISADVDRLFRGQPRGKSVPVPVALDHRAFGEDASLDPDTIRVTATVKAERSTAEVPTVPILLAVSFANLEKSYRPVTRDGMPVELMARTILVTGPTEDVLRLERGDTRAYGVIRLKEDDLEDIGTVKLMTPQYHLPDGLALAEAPEPVEFMLIEIDAD